MKMKKFFTRIAAILATFVGIAMMPTAAQACGMADPNYWACRAAESGQQGGQVQNTLPNPQPNNGGGWYQIGGDRGPVTNQSGQYIQRGEVYNPQNTLNIRTSGCSRNLKNALACMAGQTFGQILVNRSTFREQRAAINAAKQFEFDLATGGSESSGSQVTSGTRNVKCTLTVGGQTQVKSMPLSDCQAAAQKYNASFERR